MLSIVTHSGAFTHGAALSRENSQFSEFVMNVCSVLGDDVSLCFYTQRPYTYLLHCLMYVYTLLIQLSFAQVDLY